MLGDQKEFCRQSKHYSLLFLLLEDNILNVMFYHCHFQKATQTVYLLLENLDQLNDLNIGFVHIFLDLIDIYSR